MICASCNSINSDQNFKTGNIAYTVISNEKLRENIDKVDAVVYWRQDSDDAVIRVTHNNERKEGKFFIPNLTSGLTKLLKKSRMTIIMVMDEDMMPHRRTRTILNSLPSSTNLYVSYFPKSAGLK